MHPFFRLLLSIVALAAAQTFAATDIGRIDVVVQTQTIPVRISSSSPELQALAQTAFNTHGRYRLVASGHAYDIRFTPVAATQVRVDITRAGGAAVGSQIVNGTSTRNALLRAADVAVEQTNGAGLRGFFASKLAFVSKRTGRSEIYASDLFFGEAKQLTRDGAHALTPRWTPDGARIVYTSYFKSGAPDIFLVDPVTGRRDTFVSAKGTNTGARFSPNGQQVAMVLTGEGAHQIYVSNAQGRQISRKTNSNTVKASPCWSPDGSQIVFEMGEPSPQLYVMPAFGGTPRRLVTGFSYTAEPDWSRANGNKIACTVRVGGGKFQIAVYDFATGKATVASRASFDGIEPSWLADGRHLVYTARDRRQSVLCILDTETGKSTPINSGATAEYQASVWLR